MSFTQKEYQELINQLFEKHKSVQSAGFSADSFKPGLEKMRLFDKFLGRPSKKFESIHVAGTNGKGSVSHMLAAALSSKQKVGLYTSPHLVDFRERVRCIGPRGNSMIPQKDVYDFLKTYSTTIDNLGLSFFEITTGLAFWWFAKEKIDLAIIETGLGGRLDSTNIISPRLSIITSIGLDHCDILGSTRAAIAREKAGIFKDGAPALVSTRDEETAPVFEAAASKAGSRLYYADAMKMPQQLPSLDLRGDYQSANLRLVLVALSLLAYAADTARLSRTAALTGLRGRWEKLRTKPEVICDIGHNPPALKLNFAQLESMMAGGKYDKLLIVYGVMADKALDDIIPLMPADAEYFFCAPATDRALPATEIRRRIGSGEAFDSVSAALAAALSSATPNSLIYIGGSTFVVAEAIYR